MTFNIDAFIDDCKTALASAEPLTEVRQLMSAALLDCAGLKAVLPPIPGEPSRILHREEDLTVLQVSLPPGMKSPVHNHTIWAVIGIYEGQEDNRFFTDDGELIQRSARSVGEGDVVAVDETTIHAIENPLNKVTLGLHVYGGDLIAAPREVWDHVTGLREPFTQERFAEISRAVNEGVGT
jgi:predicted metal-dependent enzyme (double-stranded beta helix superfamily)